MRFSLMNLSLCPLLFALFLFSTRISAAPDAIIPQYEKPQFINIIKDLPGDFTRFARLTISPQSLPTWGVVVGTTAVTYYYDDKIYRKTKQLASHLDSDTHDRKKVLFRVAGQPFQIPDNFYTSLYHIGDGFTEILLNLSFYGYGYTQENYRSQTVAHQLTKGLILMTAVQQTLKRATGRQTPKRATTKRGRWRPFPDQKEYTAHKASYDAFPSGHVATLMTSLTIIAENYPDYPLIWPIGSGVVGILAFSMVTVGVHWVSDYPLAIALGYWLGQSIAHKEKQRQTKSQTQLTFTDKIDLVPIVEMGEGTPGLGLSYSW